MIVPVNGIRVMKSMYGKGAMVFPFDGIGAIKYGIEALNCL